MTNGIHDCIEDADTIFVIGTNTTENHPVMGYNIKKQVKYHGKKLVVADPRKIELAEHADVWLRQRCGTDVALLNGLMNYIITHDLHDKKFIEERTENFDKLWEVVKKFDLETTSRITGCEQKDIAKAGELIGGANVASLLYAMGITQHTTGTDNVLSCANLQMVCGNMGKPGGGVNPLRGQNNVQGACDMGGLPNVFPAYQKVIDENAVKKFMDAWSKPNWQCKLEAKVGLTILEMFESIEKKELRGLYIMGENPMLSDPNLDHVAHVLNECEFMVVQDIFLTETAAVADV
ncbi:MAG: molybdopterin-dependent oxidoreductase, partial [Planctomycetes bacterium]|nr:molybdopterin-dependent oxidoreductase [Planctomycetota bacterium]